ncbi:MAG: CoA transferase [Acidisphaera sp.]|nr:CoA transferase [Acidisphaera sp.]
MTAALPRRDFEPERHGPLHGVRVLDLSRLVAGNMATMLLADFGADVIKIEQPGRGDDLRNWRTKGQDTHWKVYGRNKRSVALDIKAEEGRARFRHLLVRSQVLVENFVPGTLERWGFGADALHAVNPALIVLRVSGWGQTGPYRDRPGFGTLVEAMSGFAHLNGFPDKPPAVPPLALADMIAGLYGAYATMVALRQIETNGGRGQVIDLSLFEPMVSVLGAAAANFSLTGQAEIRTGNQSTQSAPRNVYACEDGRYVAMSGSMQSMAERILRTIGGAALADDPRFRTNTDRVAHRDELDGIIGAFIAQRTQAENLALFAAAAVTVGPVCSIAELVDHPYVIGREAFVRLPDEGMGEVAMPNVVPRLDGTPGGFRRPAPRLGEHTEEVFAEIAREETA